MPPLLFALIPWETLLTRWTIRAALLLYAVVLVGELSVRGDRRWEAVGKWLWGAACGVFLVHLACAFQFYHGWSHAHAVAHTARRTGELLGFEFGEGILFSYLFALVWAADALWWLTCPACYRSRAWWLNGFVHAYLLFIAFNGAVVFESGVTRLAGVPCSAAIGLLLARRVSFRTGSAA